MPAKQKKPKAPETIDYQELTWVLNNLRSEELSELDANPPTVGEVWSWLGRMVEKDWKISFKWDYYSGAFQVTLVNLTKKQDDCGYAFSGRSDELEDAVAIAWFKYTKVAHGDLKNFAPSERSIRG